MSSSSLSSSFPPVGPQPSLNVPVLSDFLLGEEGYCRVWLRTEINQMHDKLIESLFPEQNGSSSSSSSSSAVHQHRATVAELGELLEGKKMETRMVMRGEMDRVVNSLFEGLTNKLRAYPDLEDRSQDGGDGYGARVDSLDDDQLEPSSNQPNAFVLPQQQPKSTWKPRLFTQHEMDTEFEEGNVAELFAELGLPYDDEQQQQSNHHHKSQHLHEDELEEGKDEDTRAVEGGHGDVQSTSVVKRMTKQMKCRYRRRRGRREVEVEYEVSDVSDDDDDDLGPSCSVKRFRLSRRSRITTRVSRTTDRSGSPKVERLTTVTLQCDQADCVEQHPKDQFKQHLLKKHSILFARCLAKDCKQSFHEQHLLTQHIKQAHQSTRRWHCGKCDKHFDEYKKLRAHNYLFHRLGQFKCSFPACPFTGEYTQKVLHHYVKQHTKPFICTQPGCNYATSDETKLERHQQIRHLRLKPYRCTWHGCHYASAYKSVTIRHIRGHIEVNSAAAAVPTGVQPNPRDYLEEVYE